MSEQHDDRRKDNQHTNEVHSYRSNDPHTAIPDWLPFIAGIGPEARNLIMASLVLEKRGSPPTRRQLALALHVDERSIYRWLKEIASAGALSIKREKRRRINVFHRPIPDRLISDRLITDQAITDQAITDQAITDRLIRYRDSHKSTHAAPESHDHAIPDQAISDRPSSSGSSDSTEFKELPTTNAPSRRRVLPEHIESDTGRWLMRVGFNIAFAYRFQSIPLEVAQADYERRRDLGQGNGAIINAWLVELPEFDKLNDQTAEPIPESRRAELRAKYGDLFMFASDYELPEEEST